MKRQATATWTGDLKTGTGTMSVQSGAFKDLPFSFRTRFEDAPGTNPEELIGAAHAGCFSMAFSGQLAGAGITPEAISTKSTVTMERTEDGQTVTGVLLETTVRAPGADDSKLRHAAEGAKAGCPISRLLNANITLQLTIEN